MYQTVKDGVAGILRGLGYQESTETKGFTNAATSEYNNTFILTSTAGKQAGDNHNTGFYDSQTWTLQVAFERSAANDVINRDEALVAKDSILTAINDADNWRSFVRMMKYDSWDLAENPSYFLLTVKFMVVDSYTY